MPTKSEVLNWRTDHLSAAAKTWGDQATQLDSAVQGAQRQLDGLTGSGALHDAFKKQLQDVIDKTKPKVEKLKSAKEVAESSEKDLKDAKDKAVNEIHDAEAEEFNVSEDLTVTERRSHSGLDRAWRAITRRVFEHNIRTYAQALETTDNAIADKLHGIAQDLANYHLGGPDGTTDFSGNGLQQGQVKNLGPVMGTGAPIPGIGAADLGEVIEVPDGKGGKKLIAVFGDAYGADHFAQGETGIPHYRSVAVEIKGFDANGKPIWGDVLTGAFSQDGGGVETKAAGLPALFPTTGLPIQAQNTFTLPAGSIVMQDGTTYMMVNGTHDLQSTGGSWLVAPNGNPSNGGWPPIAGTWQPGNQGPTQVSGYQAKDGTVYIAGNGFNREQGVSMYRVPPGGNVLDRSSWQPYDGHGWGAAGQPAPSLTGATHYGELSLREVDGRPVLSGLNMGNAPGGGGPQVEVRVGSGDPTSIFGQGVQTTSIMQHAPGGSNNVPCPYGGFILPGSTLDNMRIFGSQWNGPQNYNTQEIQVNPFH